MNNAHAQNRHSVYHRLINSDSNVLGDDSDMLIRELSSDIQNLLNTRSKFLFQEGPQAGSLLRYGVPDLSALNPESQSDQKKWCHWIQASLEIFETRLSNISVLICSDFHIIQKMLFKITASYRFYQSDLNLEMDLTFKTDQRQFQLHEAYYE